MERLVHCCQENCIKVNSIFCLYGQWLVGRLEAAKFESDILKALKRKIFTERERHQLR